MTIEIKVEFKSKSLQRGQRTYIFVRDKEGNYTLTTKRHKKP